MRDASQSLQVASEEEDGRGRRSRSGSHSSAKSSRGSKFTNKDLPFSLNGDKSWRNVFCDTVFDYAGTLEDPWTIKASYIQEVWDVVYPDFDHKVETSGAVFGIVSENVIIGSLLTLHLFRSVNVCVSGEENSRVKP